MIIPARNESRFLEKTLESLKNQTLHPYRIIVINDGSTDNTADVAKKFDVEISTLEDRGFRATGEPVLANVINKGLEKVKEGECNYLMILGADHIIPRNYISKIISIMEEKKDVVIASGIIKGESQRNNSPRGSGRIIRYDFWKKIGLQYPCWYGFESYIVYKALVDSYQVKVVRDAIGWSQRPTGKTTNYKSYGKAMRALGYHPLYALGRIVLSLKHNPREAIDMLRGYLDMSVSKYDIAPEVHKLQSRKIKQKLTLNSESTE